MLFGSASLRTKSLARRRRRRRGFVYKISFARERAPANGFYSFYITSLLCIYLPILSRQSMCVIREWRSSREYTKLNCCPAQKNQFVRQSIPEKKKKKYTFQIVCLPVVARVTFPLLPDSRLEHLSNIVATTLWFESFKISIYLFLISDRTFFDSSPIRAKRQYPRFHKVKWNKCCSLVIDVFWKMTICVFSSLLFLHEFVRMPSMVSFNVCFHFQSMNLLLVVVASQSR